MASYRELTGALAALCRSIRHRTIAPDSVLLSQCEALAAAAIKGNVTETPWTGFEQTDAGIFSATMLKRAAERLGIPLAEAQATLDTEMARARIFVNSRYQVSVRDQGASTYLSIKRLDQQPIRSWRDLQRIKNELVGPECEGVELFPAESRLVDTANQYHLWVMNDPRIKLPFGFDDGRNVFDDIGAGEAQAPILEP